MNAAGPRPTHVRDQIAACLAAHGVDRLFGLAGDANLFLIERMVSAHGAAYYAATHEAGAVMMADGYARVSRRLGVVSVTHGPGLTNTTTALTEAVRNGTPMLVIAGDTSPTKRFHLQNVDQRELVKAVGARFDEVRSPETAADDVAVAIRTALRDRIPVVLNVDADYLWREVQDATAPLRDTVGWLQRLPRTAPDPEDLDRALGLLAAAHRPVVLAGRGAVRSRAKDAIVALADRLGAPLATTLMAKDWFAGEPANIGICGTLSGPAQIDVLSSADCVVSFGAALTPHTTSSGDMFARATVIQCDNARSAFYHFTSVDVALLADARTAAEAMTEALSGLGAPTSTFRDRIDAAAFAEPPRRQMNAETLDPYSVTDSIRDLLPTKRTVVLDAGRFMGLPLRRIPLSDPDDFVFSCNFGSIGLGMGNAVGACVGRPDQPTVLFVGDGGFMMGGLGEFNSAVRYGLDLIVVVYNDGAYGAEYIQLERRGMGTELTEFAWPDLADVARSLGGHGITVRTSADLPVAAAAIADRDRPLLIDLRVDPATVPPVH